MEKFRMARERQKARYYGKTTDAENRRQPWTVDEMIAILNKSKTDTELSKEIGRSVKAIQVMRSRAKKRLEEGIDNG
jgi:hypothetical protein